MAAAPAVLSAPLLLLPLLSAYRPVRLLQFHNCWCCFWWPDPKCWLTVLGYRVELNRVKSMLGGRHDAASLCTGADCADSCDARPLYLLAVLNMMGLDYQDQQSPQTRF
jgi:hypothetical protein